MAVKFRILYGDIQPNLFPLKTNGHFRYLPEDEQVCPDIRERIESEKRSVPEHLSLNQCN